MEGFSFKRLNSGARAEQSETLNKLIVVKLLLAITKTEVVGLSHTLSDQRESVTSISLLNSSEVAYLPVYKSIPCISRPPILELKNKFFLFLGEFICCKTYLLS